MKKQKQIVVLIGLIFIVAMSMTASRPILTVNAQGELSEGQLMIVGIVASAVLWVLRLLASRGYQPGKEVVAIALYVIAFVIAILFTPLTIPPFPPFVDAPTFVAALIEYIGQLLSLASPIVGIAYLVYNVLLKRVLEEVRGRVAKFMTRG